LIGRITDPVSRKSTANETATSSASAAGSRAPRLDCWSANRAAAPVSCTSSSVGSARTALDQRLAPVAERWGAPADVEPPRSSADASRRGDARDAGQVRELAAQLRQLRPAGPALDGDDERLGAVGVEVARQGVGDLPRAGVDGQEPGVGAAEVRAQERQAEGEEQPRADGRDHTRPAHHGLRQAVPAARARLAGRLAAAERERVDPRAQQEQQRRQHDHRGGGSQQRHQDPAEAHRVQEALREHEQARQRRCDGRRGEQDGPPGGGQGARQGRAPVAVLDDLLAVARQHEERVVECEAEPERRRQV
jgi:hypothetical protein